MLFLKQELSVEITQINRIKVHLQMNEPNAASRRSTYDVNSLEACQDEILDWTLPEERAQLIANPQGR